MLPDRDPITVPAPFVGASRWLLSAYESLAPQAADLQPGDTGLRSQLLNWGLAFPLLVSDLQASCTNRLEKLEAWGTSMLRRTTLPNVARRLLRSGFRTE